MDLQTDDGGASGRHRCGMNSSLHLQLVAEAARAAAKRGARSAS
jgi:hypothetical protein